MAFAEELAGLIRRALNYICRGKGIKPGLLETNLGGSTSVFAGWGAAEVLHTRGGQGGVPCHGKDKRDIDELEIMVVPGSGQIGTWASSPPKGDVMAHLDYSRDDMQEELEDIVQQENYEPGEGSQASNIEPEEQDGIPASKLA